MFASRVALVSLVAFVGACSAFSSADSPASDGGTLPSSKDGGVDSGARACTDATPVDSDPENCGKCGHSCLGGACTNRVCQPVQLAAFQGDRLAGTAGEQPHVVADATHVVWSWPTGLKANIGICPHDGCPANGPPSVTHPGIPIGLTASANEIYLSIDGGQNGAVLRIGSDGGPVSISDAITAGFADPQMIFAAPDGVYFADYYTNPPDPNVSGVYRQDLGPAPSPATKVFTLTPGASWGRLVAAGGTVFIAQYNGGSGDGISRTPQTTAADPSSWCANGSCSRGVVGLATDSTSIYWSDATAQTVLSCPIGVTQCTTPAEKTTAASFDKPPKRLAMNGNLLAVETFVGAGGAGSLFACDPNSCTGQQTPIANVTEFYGAPFVSADAIYWIEDVGPVPGGSLEDCHVMRLAR